MRPIGFMRIIEIIVVFRSQKPASQFGWSFNRQFKTTRFYVLLYVSYLQFSIRFTICKMVFRFTIT
jgi:hypothetical protein